jgi:hypothetical protein
MNTISQQTGAKGRALAQWIFTEYIFGMPNEGLEKSGSSGVLGIDRGVQTNLQFRVDAPPYAQVTSEPRPAFSPC